MTVSVRILTSLAFVGFSATAGCGSSGDRPADENDREACLAVRDQMVRIRAATNIEDVDKHSQLLSDSLGDSFVARCAASMPEDTRRCVRASATASDLRACTK